MPRRIWTSSLERLSIPEEKTTANVMPHMEFVELLTLHRYTVDFFFKFRWVLITASGYKIRYHIHSNTCRLNKTDSAVLYCVVSFYSFLYIKQHKNKDQLLNCLLRK